MTRLIKLNKLFFTGLTISSTSIFLNKQFYHADEKKIKSSEDFIDFTKKYSISLALKMSEENVINDLSSKDIEEILTNMIPHPETNDGICALEKGIQKLTFADLQQIVSNKSIFQENAECIINVYCKNNHITKSQFLRLSSHYNARKYIENNYDRYLKNFNAQDLITLLENTYSDSFIPLNMALNIFEKLENINFDQYTEISYYLNLSPLEGWKKICNVTKKQIIELIKSNSYRSLESKDLITKELANHFDFDIDDILEIAHSIPLVPQQPSLDSNIKELPYHGRLRFFMRMLDFFDTEEKILYAINKSENDKIKYYMYHVFMRPPYRITNETLNSFSKELRNDLRQKLGQYFESDETSHYNFKNFYDNLCKFKKE